MLLLPFLLSTTYQASAISHCGNKIGTYIKTIAVHADSAALIKLRTNLSLEFSHDFNTLSSALKFFGSVFDMANEILEPYGVQLRADLSTLRIEGFKVNYNPEHCETKDFATTRTLKQLMVMPYGDHLILYYCKKGIISKSAMSNQDVTIIGIGLFDNLRDLAHMMKNELIREASKSHYETDGIVDLTFNSDLCAEARRNMDYEYGLKNIRHLGAENYITGPRFQKREHDLYEDVSDGQGGDPDLHATQDYSNDEELFEDYEKEK